MFLKYLCCPVTYIFSQDIVFSICPSIFSGVSNQLPVMITHISEMVVSPNKKNSHNTVQTGT